MLFLGNKEVFNVYLIESFIVEMVLLLLCGNKVVQCQFGNVNIMIGCNDFDIFWYINYGVLEFILVKSNVVLVFGVDQIYYYDDIVVYFDYSVYFIVLREKFCFNKEYLLGKCIGIFDYFSSCFGYIVFKIILQQLGLNDSNIKLFYYNLYQELRGVLLVGEVDIIFSYWGKGDEEILFCNYIMLLENSVLGMCWYLKM